MGGWGKAQGVAHYFEAIFPLRVLGKGKAGAELGGGEKECRETGDSWVMLSSSLTFYVYITFGKNFHNFHLHSFPAT